MVARTHEAIIAGYAKELAVFARPALISDATQLIGLNKCFRSDTIPAPQKNLSAGCPVLTWMLAHKAAMRRHSANDISGFRAMGAFRPFLQLICASRASIRGRSGLVLGELPSVSPVWACVI
jgi:hypothetical protein